MSKKMILLFSHQLTQPQKEDAEVVLKVDEFISMPSVLQDKWSNIPACLNDISQYLEGVITWLESISDTRDYILIQGEFGAVCKLVNWAKQNKLIPIYSTTKRVHKEVLLSNGEVEIKKTFQHVKYRKYK